MLVLSRRMSETLVIDGRIKITVLQVRGKRVRLGIEAPRSVSIARGELMEKNLPEDKGPLAALLPR